ncbi:MAG: FAD-dependent oxidoreductase [Rhodospirillaceae bacterium]|nr:FAD-dependent oxidoreductase [Rhodospirillaceae bacterium]MBL6941727.1 FAD-dependent oxidoreductase [Rhodospirillales bacterium]
MSKQFPTQAQVVIVGGGVVGCSLAYHLTKRGCSDVVLLERKQLTSGTTWHAAGLVGQLRATQNMTKLAQYTAEMIGYLEEETGQATGFAQHGSLSLACNEGRFEELKRGASMARVFGLEVEVISAKEAQDKWPLINVDDVVGAVFLPKDGKVNPIDLTQALAKGAKMGGAKIFEDTKVTAVHKKDGRITGVATDRGDIKAEVVVNCAGMWGRELGLMAGANIPLHAAEHFYIVTDNFEGMTPGLPVLRDPDNCAYFKEDAGKLLLGAFEPVAKPWGMASMGGIPDDFSFTQLPDDFDHFEPILETAMRRLPALENVGIQLFFNGPESFTPDDRYYLGPTPEVENFYVAAGFNSTGIQSAGGAGKVLADWIVDERPPMDLWDVDINRMLPFQNNARYLHDRTVEGLGLLYAMHWPFRQFETARMARTSPLHDRLKARGACFGEAGGWERANWFAPEGVEPEYQYSYGRQNWFAPSGKEHMAIRENVGLLDQTSFAKFLLQGRDAEAVINKVAANNMSVPVGKIVYTQWLNEQGGIEADLTVTRTAEDCYMIVTAFSSANKDFNWLKKRIPTGAHAVLTDVGSGMAMVSVMGPKSRALLQTLTPADLSGEAFPFATSQEIEMGYAMVRASRITYVGELGWELYIPTEFATGVYDLIVAAGEDFGLQHVGMHAMNSLRTEKAYRHWGHDIAGEDTPLEAGLGFAVAWDKPGGFIGREALEEQRKNGVRKRLVQFALDDPEPLMFHNEPIWRNDEIVGYITSGMFGHALGKSLGMGYVECENGVDADYVNAGSYEIEIACQRFPATASLKPFYDPKSERIKA